MVSYRRNYQQGGSYFFTVNLKHRKSNLLTQEIQLLRSSFISMQQQHPCQIDAIVILPSHIHTIWTLPENDCDYPKRWRTIKSLFTRNLLNKGYALTKNHRHEYQLWQKRFWEHTIRDEIDFENHFNYIHFNPVKHRLIRNVIDWPYSSFHRYVKLNILPKDWGTSYRIESHINYGE